MTKKLIQITGVMLALIVASPSMAAHHKAEEAASVLELIESNVRDIREQASRIQSYNRVPNMHDWRLHNSEFIRINAETERIAELMESFKELRSDATARQAIAFNKLVPVMANLRESANQAIEIINDEKEKLLVAHPDYASKVNAVYDGADEAITILDVAESWFELRESWKTD